MIMVMARRWRQKYQVAVAWWLKSFDNSVGEKMRASSAHKKSLQMDFTLIDIIHNKHPKKQIERDRNVFFFFGSCQANYHVKAV
jgi:hypothetical protein